MASAIGIDIGGTFIDIVIAGEEGVQYVKVPSTPGSPADGVLDGLSRLIDAGTIEASTVERVIHGSTVATNALLEGSWARTALVMTRGFRDVLEIGRQHRPRLFDPFFVRSEPIVSRDLRFEVTERLDAGGHVLIPLDREDVEELIPLLREAEVEAIAVSFLFSFLDPTHEREVRRILAPALDVPVVVSSDVLPEFREYERTSTTVIAAALRPVVGKYVSRLEAGAQKLGLPERWQIMQSSGAVTSAQKAEEEPARVLLSGPAGGVEGARAIGTLVGEPNLITMDMGGTSCDVALVCDGRIGWSTSGNVGGHPVALPMVEIHTIGAGGGSIAWMDGGGALRVGPESAGANPGPACYGRGGERPTVTDAHLLLGHFLADRPIGGLRSLNLDRAASAVRSIAEPLGLTTEGAAFGILEVSDAAMERAVRVISVERGRDPRDCALVAFGGAGPLHAVSVARRLSIPRVIVPECAGVLSAYGLLTAEAGHDYSRSVVRPLRGISADAISQILAELRNTGTQTLRAEGVPDGKIRFRASVDLRYVGQSHELNVDLPTCETIEDAMMDALAASFHEVHAERFGHAALDEAIELITLRVRAFSPSVEPLGSSSMGTAALDDKKGEAWFGPEGPTETLFVDRARLRPGEMLTGPLVVCGAESTLLVPPGVRGERDRFGTILLEVG